MNLILHQLRIDIRALRWMLVLWFVFLGLELFKEIGWVGTVEFHSTANGVEHTSDGTRLLTAVLWLLFLLLPSLVILADSPAKTDGFLNARPMPKRDLYLAKALFIMLLVVTPVVLLEVLHLAIKGLPIWFVFHGALERLAYAIPLAAIAAGFAGLWRDGKQWSAALAAALAGWVLALILMDFLNKSITPTLQELFLFTILILLVVRLNYHYRWRISIRGLGVFCAYGSLVILTLYWPWDLFKPQGSDSAVVNKLAKTYSLAVPLPKVSISCESKLDKKLSVRVRITPHSDGIPEDCFMEWAGGQQSSELILSSGKKCSYQQPEVGHILERLSGGISPRDLSIFSSLLGADAHFLDVPSCRVRQEDVLVGAFEINPDDDLPGTPAHVEANLTGRLCQWRKVAVLPLTPKATVKDSSGQWRLMGTGTLGQTFSVGIQREQMSLETSSDLEVKSSDANHALSRYQFVLYHTNKALGQLQFSHVQWPQLSKSTLTAYPSYFVKLDFFSDAGQLDSLVKNRNTQGIELVVFEKVYIGSLQQQWQSPAFVPGDFLAVPSGVTKNDKLTPAELDRRLAAVAEPKTTSRAEVGRYLGEVLHIVGWPGRLPIDHPLRARLLKLVPDSLPVLLDALAITSAGAHELLFSSIQQGVQESQKAQIIAALRRQPELASIVLERGWNKEARDSLYQLLETPKRLPHAAIQIIALFEDPATYSRLLAELEAAPDLQIYEILHALPGIGSRLDQAVNRIWAERDRSIDGSDLVPRFISVAMRHGKVEALEEAYWRFDRRKSGGLGTTYELVKVFQENASPMPQSEGMDGAFEWVGKHRPEDFRYDARLRRFILKDISAAKVLKSSSRREKALTSFSTQYLPSSTPTGEKGTLEQSHNQPS